MNPVLTQNLQSAARICQTVVAQTEHDGVVRALLAGALDMTGGRRAALVLVEPDALLIEAIAEHDGTIAFLRLPLVDSEHVPLQEISQVVKTRESVSREQSCCVPMINQAGSGTPAGALYVECAPAEGGRSDLVALIASQAAVALENARHFGSFRQAERALAQSEEKYRALYTNTPMMLHSIDPAGRLVSVSRRWLETLGYEWEEVIGRKSIEFLTPESAKLATDVVLPAYFKTGVCTDIPYQFVKKNGETVDVELSAIAERDDSGEIRRSFAVLVDVTDLKRAEAERRRLAEREESARAEADSAKALSRLTSAFLSSVSHELRTPLTTLWGFTELLRNEPGPPGSPQREAYADHIIKSIKRLKSLVGDLLDSASIEAGTFMVRQALEDLGETVHDAIESMGPLFEAAKVEVAVDMPDGRLEAWIDGGRVRQVLVNLLGNAIKYSPEGGRIAVRAISAYPLVRCEVIDGGPGITPEALPRLFKRFSQVQPGLSGSGTGLGLSICKAIVTAHGGYIGVLSRPGSGSTFWFTLPVDAQSDEIAPGAPRD